MDYSIIIRGIFFILLIVLISYIVNKAVFGRRCISAYVWTIIPTVLYSIMTFTPIVKVLGENTIHWLFAVVGLGYLLWLHFFRKNP